MRIEINSGGLNSPFSSSMMLANIDTALNRSSSLVKAFERVRAYAYNMNGGVGTLQDAVSNVEQRLASEDTINQNLAQAQSKVASFLELARRIDLQIAGSVNKNKQEFYAVNEWARPPQSSDEKSLGEKAWDWLCSTGEAIADTAKKAWDGIKSFYSTVKEKLTEVFEKFKAWWKDHTTITPTVIDDEVFDTETKNPSCSGSWQNGGMYGSWQGAPAYRAASDGTFSEIEQKYLDILRRRLTPKEYELISNNDLLLYNYLDELESHGCGYAAMVNTVFEYYCNRPNGAEEFEAKFGFPLRNADGLLNYDLMMVDIYSYENGYGHSSTGADDRKRILTNYMQNSGVDGNSSVKVDIKNNISITVKNYDNYAREGKQIIVRADRFKLYDENGNPSGSCGAHAMVVTGVTEDGKFIVSSWGNKYMIDPNDVGEEVYWSENGKRQSDKVGRMSFTMVDYH